MIDLGAVDRLTPAELAELDALLLADATAHTEYQSDPIGWAQDKLGIPRHTLVWSENSGYANHDWDGTPDPLATAFEAIRDWHDVAVESGTGTGKSFGVAVLILWFLACFENAEVYTFALNEDQLKLFIWKNIGELWPRFQAHFPTAELTSLTIRMKGGIDETWSAHGRAVQIRAGESIATRAAGMHAEHMLLVYEEMAGMDPSVPAAGKNTCTAPHNLRIGIGNPNHQLDTLHRMTQEPGVVAIRASALDHPNVVTRNASLVPGAVSQVSIDKRLAEYGEDDPIYQSRVRGLSPEQAANALIRLEWLKSAALRYQARASITPRTGSLDSRGEVSRNTGKYAIDPLSAYGSSGSIAPLETEVTGKGVDVANSEHGDRGAIVDFAGNAWIRCETFACPDSNELGRRVHAEMVDRHRSVPLSPQRVGVDAIGVGAGTVNELRRLGSVVNAIYAGGKPMAMTEKMPDGRLYEWSPDVNKFKNLRGQMYWQAREDLREGRIDGPEDLELWQELTAVTFEDVDKVVVIQPKDEIRELLGRSPDKADAFVMANWVRARIFRPERPEVRQGQTPGYDYAKQQPRERETGEQWLERQMGRQRVSPIAGRVGVHRRKH